MIEDDKVTSAQEEEFKRLLDEDTFKISQIGEIVKGDGDMVIKIKFEGPTQAQ